MYPLCDYRCAERSPNAFSGSHLRFNIPLNHPCCNRKQCPHAWMPCSKMQPCHVPKMPSILLKLDKLHRFSAIAAINDGPIAATLPPLSPPSLPISCRPPLYIHDMPAVTPPPPSASPHSLPKQSQYRSGDLSSLRDLLVLRGTLSARSPRRPRSISKISTLLPSYLR